MGDASGMTSAVKEVEAALDRMNGAGLEKVTKRSKESVKAIKELQKGIIDSSYYGDELGEVLSTRIKLNKIQNARKELNRLTESFTTSVSWATRLGETIANTFRYQIVNNFTDELLQGIGEVRDYLEEIDNQINHIQIVSGKSASAMAGFKKQAELSAGALGKQTKDYLEAAQIYFQQGLSQKEVTARTNATIKAANISGQSVKETADQITAVLNGFQVEASKINTTLDMMSALGASTASDFEELSKASQKVASAAHSANIPLESTLSMLTTMVSVTREAPESIGTSLNAIIGRFNKLGFYKGAATSSIESVLKASHSGLSIFKEENGQIKNMEVFLNELSEKWKELDSNQQKAITSALAGTRQANRLMALLNNWDTYLENKKIAANSQGTTEAQQDVYMRSIEAMKNTMESAKNAMWNKVFDTSNLKDLYKLLTDIYDVTGNVVRSFGGLGGVLTRLGGLLGPIAVKYLSPLAANAVGNAVSSLNKTSANEAQNAATRELQEQFNELFKTKVKLLTAEERTNSLTEEQNLQYGEMEKKMVRMVELQRQIELSKKNQKVFSEYTKDEIASFSLLAEKLNSSKILNQYNSSKASAASYGAKVYSQLQSFNFRGLQNYYDPDDPNITEIDYNREYFNAVKKKLEDRYKLAPDRIGAKANVDRTLGMMVEADPKMSGTHKEALRTLLLAMRSYESALIDSEKQERSIQEENFKRQHALELLTGDLRGISSEDSKKYRDIIGMTTSLRGATSLSPRELIKADLIQSGEKYNGLTAAEQEIIRQWLGNLDYKTSEMSEKIKSFLTSRIAGISHENAEIDIAASKAQREMAADRTTPQDLAEDSNKGKLIVNTQKAISVGAAAVATFTGLAAAVKAYGDESLSTQEKVQGMTSAIGSSATSLGSTLMFVGGPMMKIVGAVSMGLGILATTVLPFLIEKFHLFEDAVESTNTRIKSLKESMTSATSSVQQQITDLKNVTNLYTRLAKKYNEQAFVYSELTEQERSQYDQVADYIKNYAPELVAYYDKEGKAILNLSKYYDAATISQKNYLDKKVEANQITTYSNLQDQAGDMGNALIGNYGASQQKITELQHNIYKLQQDSLQNGKDHTKELEKQNEKLAEYKTNISTIAETWSKLVANAIVMGQNSYGDLTDDEQNMMLRLASYSSYLTQESQYTDTNAFMKKVQEIQNAYASLTEDTRIAFMSLDEAIRQSVLSMAMNLQLSGEQLKNYLTEMQDESAFLSGAFLDKYANASQRNSLAEARGARSAAEQDYQSAQNAVNAADYDDYAGSAGSQIAGDTSAENAEKASEASSRIVEANNAIAQSTYEVNLAYVEWTNKMVEIAESSPENYNKIIDSVYSINEELLAAQQELEEAKTAAAEAEEAKRQRIGEDAVKSTRTLEDAQLRAAQSRYDSIEKRQQSLYAALYANDASYYDAWLKQNYYATTKISELYGVDAKDYRTYAEYKAAIDEATAISKQYWATLANKGIAEAEKELTKNQMVQALRRAATSENAYEREAAIAALAYEEIGQSDKAQKLLALSNLDKQLAAAEGAANGQITMTEAEYNDMAKLLNSYVTQAGATLNSFGANFVPQIMGSVTAGAAGVQSIKNAREAVAKAMSDLEKDSKKDLNAEQKSKFEALKKTLNDRLTQDLEALTSSFNFNIGGGFGIPDYKDIPSFSEVDNSDPAAGGGGGKDKSPKENEWTKEIDPLRRYTEAIKELDFQIKRLEQDRAMLYGEDYLNNLKKSEELQKKDIEAMKLKLQASKLVAQQRLADANSLAAALGVAPMQTDSNGLIANYNDIVQSLVDKAKALDSESREAFGKQADKLIDFMDKYVKYANEIPEELESSIAESLNKLDDAIQNRIEYPIKIAIEAKEKDRNIIDFLETAGKLNRGNINVSVGVSANAARLSSLKQQLNDIVSSVGLDGSKLFSDVDGIKSASKRLAALRQQQENIMSVGKNLASVIENMEKALSSTFDTATKALDDAFAKLTSVDNLYNKTLSTMEALNTNSVEAVQKINDRLDANANYKISELQKQAETLTNIRNMFTHGSNEWVVANAKLLANVEAQLKLQQEIIDRQKKLATAAIKEQKDEIARQLFGGYTAEEMKAKLKELTDERDRYLAAERRIYLTNQLSNTIEKDTEKYKNNPSAQAKLKDFWKKELTYLNSKEKLKQADIDLSNKQYALLKAYIDLQEAYENKKYTKVLQRDSSGNYGYIYQQDTSNREAAGQKYQKAIDDYYQWVSKRMDTIRSESVNLQSSAIEDVSKAATRYQNGQISKEKFEEQVKSIQEKLSKKLEENANELKSLKKDLVGTTELQGMADKGMTKELDNMISELINGAGENFKDFYERTTGKKIDDVAKDINNNGITNMNEDWSKFFNIVESGNSKVGAIADGINKFMPYIDEYKASLAAMNETLTKIATEQLPNITAGIVENTSNLNANYLNELNTAVKELKTLFYDHKDEWINLVNSAAALIKAIEDKASSIDGSNAYSNATSNLTSAKKYGKIGVGVTGEISDKLSTLDNNDLNTMLAANNVASIQELVNKANANTMLIPQAMLNKLVSDSDKLAKQITIQASFPNATMHEEIEAAFNSLINNTSQYLGKK